MTTAMTVVAIMILRALPLDSWMPNQVLAEEVERDEAGDRDRAPGLDRPGASIRRSKAEDAGGRERFEPRPTMYCPAETPLMGPVRT